MSPASYLFGVVSLIASTPPTVVPELIVNSYTDYLWDYRPESWVAKIASFYRVLALLIALPVIILGVLDIVSYGIARTLGIVDDVKASTSDKVTGPPPTLEIPVIHFQGEITPTSDSNNGLGHHKAISSLLAASQPKAFYASDSDGLELAGADVFSPAASEPSSPSLPQKTPLAAEKINSVDLGLQEGLRRRVA